jgi:creatinine amidohydrolase/Fe(II)-dependent formamide hydrolase-like protein
MSDPGRSVYLAELTWPEAKEAFAAAEVVLIPLGSNEQHGPGMTLATDITLATAVAGRVAERMRPRAIVAPSLPFGLSPHHMRFPGTISLQPATFSAVLFDTMRSLKAHGAKRFFLLNGHGGNQAMLTVIATQARIELGVPVATAIYLVAAADLLKERFGRAYAHACEIEASLGWRSRRRSSGKRNWRRARSCRRATGTPRSPAAAPRREHSSTRRRCSTRSPPTATSATPAWRTARTAKRWSSWR